MVDFKSWSKLQVTGQEKDVLVRPVGPSLGDPSLLRPQTWRYNFGRTRSPLYPCFSSGAAINRSAVLGQELAWSCGRYSLIFCEARRTGRAARSFLSLRAGCLAVVYPWWLHHWDWLGIWGPYGHIAHRCLMATQDQPTSFLFNWMPFKSISYRQFSVADAHEKWWNLPILEPEPSLEKEQETRASIFCLSRWGSPPLWSRRASRWDISADGPWLVTRGFGSTKASVFFSWKYGIMGWSSTNGWFSIELLEGMAEQWRRQWTPNNGSSLDMARFLAVSALWHF